MKAGTSGLRGASLPLQVFLHVSLLYCPVWGIVTISLLIYKGVNLPFPEGALPAEICGCFLLYLLQYIACSLGKKGNLMELPVVLAISMVLLFICNGAVIYYMWLQTYVMRLDLGMSATFLCLDGIAFLLCIVAMQSAATSGTPPAALVSTAPPVDHSQPPPPAQAQQSSVPQPPPPGN